MEARRDYSDCSSMLIRAKKRKSNYCAKIRKSEK